MNESPSNKSQQYVALITGATGFVGSHLVNLLIKEGWQVHILSRPNAKRFNFSRSNNIQQHYYDGHMNSVVSCMTEAQPDVVFHLASLFLSQHNTEDVSTLIASNVLFGTQVLEAMKLCSVSCIINTGTSWQHYENQDYNPVCLYAATKQAFEDILEFYVQALYFKSITLELFDTYGSNDPRPKLFHLLNKAVATGQPLDMSGGEQLIDLVHIDDVTSAYLLAAYRLLQHSIQKREIYAISSGNPLPLKELIELYTEINQKPLQINWGARPYRDREVMIPWNKGEALPSWQPQIDLRKGIQRLMKVSESENSGEQISS
jgi:nucleoside-diphosphate-sugar epimerase